MEVLIVRLTKITTINGYKEVTNDETGEIVIMKLMKIQLLM
jgi:hypothetical protein